MKIWAHTLVKNEDKYVWYAVMSAISWVDKILLWDTGSTDKTLDIIKEIKQQYPQKIELKFFDNVDIYEYTKLRRKMLDETTSDWFIMLDGDEVWWDESIERLVKYIKRNGEKYESIVVPTINLIGDIYHFQEEAAGMYKLVGRKGHLNLRAVNRKIEGLSIDKPHGTSGWVDNEGRMIQDRDEDKIKFLALPYMHFTFLQRSQDLEKSLSVPKRKKKLKYEVGKKFPLDYHYPEVFFRKRPKIVPSPWENMDNSYLMKALVQTPLKKIKRRIFRGKVGY